VGQQFRWKFGRTAQLFAPQSPIQQRLILISPRNISQPHCFLLANDRNNVRYIAGAETSLIVSYPVQHGTTELCPTQQPSSLPTISHSALNLRNGDQKTAADAKRVFMTGAKFVLVAWFEIPAESMLFGWPKHEVRGNLSTY
jgi:hypothetical protein